MVKITNINVSLDISDNFTTKHTEFAIIAMKIFPQKYKSAMIVKLSFLNMASVLTDSSSFSMPLGIWGTARLIAEYSWMSGSSSARQMGIGFEGSNALARNDNFVDIFFYTFLRPCTLCLLVIKLKFIFHSLSMFETAGGPAETENCF